MADLFDGAPPYFSAIGHLRTSDDDDETAEGRLPYVIIRKTIDNYIEARNEDYLPDDVTAQVLGMLTPRDESNEEDNTAARRLYGAFKTLQLHGRFSRTMMEMALMGATTTGPVGENNNNNNMAADPSSYPKYVELLMRSLPPNERSRYAASLYNGMFSKVIWDHQIYGRFVEQLHGRPLPSLPVPLGDDRHVPQHRCVSEAAEAFIMNMKFLFEMFSEAPLWARCLEPDYMEYQSKDALVMVGPALGFDKDDLVFGAPPIGRTMSQSELMLRCWAILFAKERLCKTELEDAFVKGPARLRSLLQFGIFLVQMEYHDTRDESLQGPEHVFAWSILQAVRGLLKGEEGGVVVFKELPIEGETQWLMECDYCGKSVDRKTLCSRCQKAMYCSHECQKGDWKRHKPGCHQYAATNSSD